MDFVLVLHSHLPYVLKRGRWPHGSDWICEAALDTYLPLYEALSRLRRDGVPAPITIGFTPILANQLASDTFAREMEEFFEQRLAHCRQAVSTLPETNDGHLIPVTRFWEARLARLRDLFRSCDRDLVGAFRDLERDGLIEILGSSATHGFLPLLARDESIRLQLGLGRAEHQRLFGRAPRGCWLPECAYRPTGKWNPLPGERRAVVRAGTDVHLARFGFRYFITDAHMASAGSIRPGSSDLLFAGEGMPAEQLGGLNFGEFARSPYHSYRLGGRNRRPVATLVRDPRASQQVWSRQEGYPGDAAYLEFHKIRWPHGLKLWRVTGAGVDLGGKQPYDPPGAQVRAEGHAGHFAWLLQGIARLEGGSDGEVIVVPFDTELFGHWWFEGVDFLQSLYRRLAGQGAVHPVTGSQHLRRHPPRVGIRLAAGSWGARGDYSMWLNPDTVWTWRRMWTLEDAFWDAVPGALAVPGAQPIIEQAARELLLAQASDWQFIISTGEVRDYGEQRFELHCDAAERLVGMLETGDLEAGARFAEEMKRIDDPFPDILPTLASALESEKITA